MNTTLTPFETLNTENIRFADTFEGTYKTIIPIEIKDDDDNVYPLIVNTPPNLLTFGIQEITDKNKENVIGYQLPICLWGKRQVSNEERLFTKKIEEIVEYVKTFLRSIKEEVNITDEMIDRLNVLNWKYENGVRCEDRGPLLYTKLLMNNKSQKILTNFIDEKTNNYMDPFDILNKKGIVTSAIKIENIIIGKRITLQLKIFEVLYKKIPIRTEKKNNIRKSLLRPDIQIKKFNKKIVEPEENTNVEDEENVMN
jgi:hypothetical protein